MVQFPFLERLRRNVDYMISDCNQREREREGCVHLQIQFYPVPLCCMVVWSGSDKLEQL